ncbi:MAG: 2-hydroxyacid dehydrogenase, partial [Akkermansiaceae bacterium]
MSDASEQFPRVAFYDTKPYDKVFFDVEAKRLGLAIQYHEFRLNEANAASAKGAVAVCVFVNDPVNSACLKNLAELGIRFVALRCAGFNNIDLEAAKSHGIKVVRVPAYSPYSVAEHTLA